MKGGGAHPLLVALVIVALYVAVSIVAPGGEYYGR